MQSLKGSVEFTKWLPIWPPYIQFTNPYPLVHLKIPQSVYPRTVLIFAFILTNCQKSKYQSSPQENTNITSDLQSDRHLYLTVPTGGDYPNTNPGNTRTNLRLENGYFQSNCVLQTPPPWQGKTRSTCTTKNIIFLQCLRKSWFTCSIKQFISQSCYW